MRVVELSAVHVRIPLKKPFRHASYTRTDSDNVLVRCSRVTDIATCYGVGKSVLAVWRKRAAVA